MRRAACLCLTYEIVKIEGRRARSWVVESYSPLQRLRYVCSILVASTFAQEFYLFSQMPRTFSTDVIAAFCVAEREVDH